VKCVKKMRKILKIRGLFAEILKTCRLPPKY